MKTGTVFLIVLALAVVGLLLFEFKCHRHNDGDVDMTGTKDSLLMYRNQNNQLTFAIKQREEIFNREREGLLDSIARIYRTTGKQIRDLTILTTKGKTIIYAKGKPEIKYVHDTVRVEGDDGYPDIEYVSQAFNSPYYSGRATLYMNDAAASKFEIESRDTMTILTREVTEGGFFSRRRYLQQEFVFANPDNHVTGAETYRRPLPKQKRWGIGIYGGYGITPKNWKPEPQVGAGLFYNVIKF